MGKAARIRRMRERLAETGVRPTGIVQPVPARAYGGLPEPKPGEHLWTVLASFYIADPASAFDPAVEKTLDAENMLSLSGPGCLVCEQTYTPATAGQPCPGEPTSD